MHICIRFIIRSSSIFIFHRIINYCSLYKNMLIFVYQSIFSRFSSFFFYFFFSFCLLRSFSLRSHISTCKIYVAKSCLLIADVVHLVSSSHLLFKSRISLVFSPHFRRRRRLLNARESLSAFHAWSHAYQVPSR